MSERQRGRDSNADRKEVKERWKRWRRGRRGDKGGETGGKTKSESLQKTEGHAEGIQRKRENH